MWVTSIYCSVTKSCPTLFDPMDCCIPHFYVLQYLPKFAQNSQLPRWLRCKESACSVGDLSSIPGSGITPAEGNGNPLQYSCPENSMDRGAWRATVHGVANNQTWLSDSHFHFHFHVHQVSDAIQPAHPFSSCPQFSPTSGSFQMSWLFTSGGPSIGASALASVLAKNI